MRRGGGSGGGTRKAMGPHIKGVEPKNDRGEWRDNLGAVMTPVVTLTLLLCLLLDCTTPVLSQSGHLGVLLNTTEQLDPLVAMNLTQLRELNSTQTSITDTPPFYSCDNITTGLVPHINGNGNWTTTCDAPNVNITSLTVTYLGPHANATIPSSIVNMFALRNLTMSGINLQSSLPSTLGFLGFLGTMNFSMNSLNGSLPGTLFSLTNLTTLDLSNNQLSGSIPTAISQMTALEHLNLGRNYFYGAILENLPNLTQLTYLNISGYPYGPAGQTPTIRMPTAIPLNLSFNDNITTVGSLLSPLGNLTTLDLSNTGITGNISLLPWKDLTNLTYIDITNTTIFGTFDSYVFYLTNFSSTLEIKATNLASFCDVPTVPFDCANQMNNTGFCDLCENICYCTPSGFPTGAIIGIVIGSAFLITAVLVGAYFFLRAKRFDDGVDVHGVRRFSIPELTDATNNYSIHLGKGGFGDVYKGTVSVEDDETLDVAVKVTKAERRRNTKKFDSGFRNEILVLSGVRHRNLVEMVGYASKGADVSLVFEFIARGSLDDILKNELGTDGGNDISLTWGRRLKVAFGAAQGLDYLHSGSRPPIIHRDVKSSNILVDEDYNGKVGDFGLSKIRPEMDIDPHKSTNVQGTMGYIDPEYAATLVPTERSDVYSFGVVILELATGWRPIGGPEKKHIIQRVAKGVNGEGFESIVAPSIRKELEGNNGEMEQETAVIYKEGPGAEGEDQEYGAEITVAPFSMDLFQRLVRLGMQCCAKDSSTRPSMRLVAKALGEIIEGKAEYLEDEFADEHFDEQGDEMVILTHNLGGESGATVSFVMSSQAGPR